MSILEARAEHVRAFVPDDAIDAPRIRPLRLSDYDRGFIEALSALRPTELSRKQFSEIFHSLGEHCRVWVVTAWSRRRQRC